MKRLQKLLAFGLIATMLLSMLAGLSVAYAAGGNSGTGVSYTSTSQNIPSDSRLLVTGTEQGIRWSLYASGTLVIEPIYSGQSAPMPNYSSSIYSRPWGGYSFAITTVIIADGVLSVGEYAFADMNNITRVSIGTHTTTIGAFAFMNCLALQRVELSAATTAILGQAFYGCKALTQVITPLTINQMSIASGNSAFGSAINSSSPSTPSQPATVASGRIDGTSIYWNFTADNVLSVISTAGAEALPNYASAPAPWAKYAPLIASIKLSGITKIGYYAFADMPLLTSIDFGITEEIQSYAFRGALSLQTVDFPASLVMIHDNAFVGSAPINASTPNLQVLLYISPIGNNISVRYGLSSDSILPDDPSSEPDPNPTPDPIPEALIVGSCGNGVYYTFDPNNGKMTISGSGAIYAYGESKDFPWFDFAYDILEIEIQQGVTQIPARAFYKTGALIKITIPNSLTYIGDYAFYLSNNLKTVVIDNSANGIHIGAQGNSNLTKPAVYTNNGYVPPSTDPDELRAAGVIEGTGISWEYNVATGELLIYSFQEDGEDMPDYLNYNSVLKYGNGDVLAPWAHLTPLVRKLTLRNISHIGAYAFSDMKNLATVNFEGSLYSIGSYAFARDAAISQLVFPKMLVIIEDHAFAECSLSTIATTPLLNEGSISIGMNNTITILQEEDPTIPKEGYIPGTNIYWNFQKAGGVLTLLATVDAESIPNMTLGQTPWQPFVEQITTIRMQGIQTIGSYAFANMPVLRTVEFAPETTAIGAGAFMKAYSLRSLTLPPLLTLILQNAFEGCVIQANASQTPDRLTIASGNTGLQITYSQEPGLTDGNHINGTMIYWSFSDGVLTVRSMSGSGEALPSFSSSAQTPWNAHRTSVTKVVLQDILRIGNYAFADMPYLQEVQYAKTLREIGSYAFANDSSLKSQTLPASLTTIYAYAYNNCYSLITTTPNMPGIMSIQQPGNTGLIWVWDAEEPEIPDYSQWRDIFGTDLKWRVVDGVLSISGSGAIPMRASQVTDLWGGIKNTITSISLSENITAIGAYAFQDLTSLREITLPDTLTVIGQSAFDGCTALERVNLPASVESLGEYAFRGCRSLTTLLVFKGALATVPVSAFSACDALTSVYYTGTETEWRQLVPEFTSVLGRATYQKAIAFTVEFVQPNNQPISPAVTAFGIPGDVVQVTPPVLDHYSTQEGVIRRTLRADESYTVVYEPERYSLTIRYTDERGKEIAPSSVFYVYYNEEFKRSDTAVLPVIEGWRAMSQVVDLGVITGPIEPISVVYVPCEYVVTVMQVDESGHPLNDKVYTFTAEHGSDVTINPAELDAIAHYEPSKGNKYQIKHITSDTSCQIVYQKKAYPLTIYFEDANGLPIAGDVVLTAYYGEPVRYELPSLEAQGYLPLDTTVLTLDAYAGQSSMVARYKRIGFTLQLQFVKLNGEKVRENETIEIAYGTDFVYEVPVIAGYTPSQSVLYLGVVTAQPQSPMTIEYAPMAYDLTIQFFNQNGDLLSTQVIPKIQVGSAYKITPDPVDGYLTEGIVIEGTIGAEETAPVISIVLEKAPSAEPQPEPTPDEPTPTPQNPSENPSEDSTEVEPKPAPSHDPQSSQQDTLSLSPIAILALVGGGIACVALGAVFSGIIRKRKS